MVEQEFATNRQKNDKKRFLLQTKKKKCVTHCNRVARLSDPLKNRKSMTRKLTQSRTSGDNPINENFVLKRIN